MNLTISIACHLSAEFGASLSLSGQSTSILSQGTDERTIDI